MAMTLDKCGAKPVFVGMLAPAATAGHDMAGLAMLWTISKERGVWRAAAAARTILPLPPIWCKELFTEYSRLRKTWQAMDRVFLVK